MAAIEPRPGKGDKEKFRVRITLKGHPRVSETFDTRRQAERWAQRTEAAMREGRFSPGSEAEVYTLGEMVTRFLDEELQGGRRDRSQAKQIRWWETELGSDTKLAQIKAPRIVEARNRLMQTHAPSGRPVSTSTANRYLAALSKMFTLAVQEWFWLEKNPCSNVKRRKEPRGRVRFLAEDERQRLVLASKASADDRMFLLVHMAIATGARQGELLGLMWRDIAFERGVATFEHTKNGEVRSVPLASTSLALLRTRLLHSPGTRFVFEGASGKAAFPRKPWNRAVQEAGLDDFHFHDLRHTAAAYLAMSGATLLELAEILGHKTLAMVKRYAHLTEAHTRGVVERMNEKYLDHSPLPGQVWVGGLSPSAGPTLGLPGSDLPSGKQILRPQERALAANSMMHNDGSRQ